MNSFSQHRKSTHKLDTEKGDWSINFGAMTKLPPGWWIKNSEGSFAGPPPLPEDDPPEYASEDGDHEKDQDTIGDENALDIRPDSPGWEDMEPDTENFSVQCLLCSQQFPSPATMLDHCKDKHTFDFVGVVQFEGLDFYKTIKYVNSIRSRVRDGVATPTHIDSVSLDSDDLLKPTLENDALLFSLDDVINFEAEDESMEGVSGDGKAP